MTIVAGVDGCKTGWLCIAKDLNTGLITSAVFSNAQLLLQREPEPSIIAVDIPIGLTGNSSTSPCPYYHLDICYNQRFLRLQVPEIKLWKALE
jgi:predicted RNase H-like nuclease